MIRVNGKGATHQGKIVMEFLIIKFAIYLKMNL